MKKQLIFLSLISVFNLNIRGSEQSPSQFPFNLFYFMKVNVGGIDVRAMCAKLNCHNCKSQRALKQQHQDPIAAAHVKPVQSQQGQANILGPQQAYAMYQQVAAKYDVSGNRSPSDADAFKLTPANSEELKLAAELKQSNETRLPVHPATGNSTAHEASKSPELEQCEINIELLEEIAREAGNIARPFEERRQKMALSNEKLNLQENCDFCLSTKGILRSNLRDPKDPIFTHLALAIEFQSLLAIMKPQEIQQQLTGWTSREKGRALTVAGQINKALAEQRKKKAELLAKHAESAASFRSEIEQSRAQGRDNAQQDSKKQHED
jgi:hypothetical protein